MTHIILVKRWARKSVEADKTTLYIFGDNDIHVGRGGQAVIRDLPNAMGIPTKKKPSLDESSFYSDQEFKLQKQKIRAAVNQAIEAASSFRRIALPEDGLGTGLAQLDVRAPKTFDFLQEEIQRLVDSM